MASRGQFYQISLIGLTIVASLLYGTFFLREINPEYRQFQSHYEELEDFRSGITGEPVAPFRRGIKQLVLSKKDHGPETIDRCTTCHVALELGHFSPSKIAHDVNGEMMLDDEGIPIQVPNEQYVWGLVDQRISLLHEDGSKHALKEAARLEALKVGHVGHLEIDMTKALAMHPLIGKETRPFELHPIEEYGCTSCHSGNGRALTMEKAHGPVFDGQYHESYEGPRPEFLEKDPENDPIFSRVFNHKPGHGLLFQTTPIMVGGLIQANCVQCHQSNQSLGNNTDSLALAQPVQLEQVLSSDVEKDVAAIKTLLSLRDQLRHSDLNEVLAGLRAHSKDYTLPEKVRDHALGQIRYLNEIDGDVQEKIWEDLKLYLGTDQAIRTLAVKVASAGDGEDPVAEMWMQSDPSKMPGLLFKKKMTLSLPKASGSYIDGMTDIFHRGKELYFSQACYACHRVAGLARGGVGPELTEEGYYYPWFIKESMVWPQADLRTSTMPNFHLDHEELEALTTYLLSLKGKPTATSEVDYHVAIKQWEEGKKLPNEQALEPTKITDLHYGMTVFATEGCASCHRLKGFSSNVGFAVEKGTKPSFEALYNEQEWFKELIYEDMTGSDLVATIDKHSEEIDRRIVHGVREGSILEELEHKFPKTVEALYAPFKYALRAKNTALADDPQALDAYIDRVHRVLMAYVQEYGLGRLIGPRISWSGIYRSDQWLMEHFYNPAAHVARSIMPVFPFDETKFQALTYTLDVLAKQNTDKVRAIWEQRGFNAEEAFDLHCSQCHGTFREGGGPVAEWLYPIPKSLRNAGFLRNMTKDRVIESIVHGVKGGPMPPWGELAEDKPFKNDVPVLTEGEIAQMVDWLFLNLPKGAGIGGDNEERKWQYEPEDVLEELINEGDVLQEMTGLEAQSELEGLLSAFSHPQVLFAALDPVVPVSETKTQTVTDIFEKKNNPIPNVDREAYYIRKKFYTPENLASGEALFMENCAVCHGKEGAGTGLRAASMVEAKPRMLTNLDWLGTRDDLRLLRSIKYGVVGTAMTPWGDFTSGLQRLQLVMYIRSLSSEGVLRDRIQQALYSTYDRAVNTVRELQIPQYALLTSFEQQIAKAQYEKKSLSDRLAVEPELAEEAALIYQRELALEGQLQKQRQVHKILDSLIDEIQAEKAIYEALGATMLSSLGDDSVIEVCLDLIVKSANRYHVRDQQLVVAEEDGESDPFHLGALCIMEEMDKQVTVLKSESERLMGRLPSLERRERLSEIDYKLNSYIQFKNQITASLEEARRSHQRQKAMVERANKIIRETDTSTDLESSWMHQRHRPHQRAA